MLSLSLAVLLYHHSFIPSIPNPTHSPILSLSLSKMPPVSERKYRRSPKTLALLPTNKVDYYEPLEAETAFDGASLSGAVFNLSTTIVGAGIMALPATVKQLGLIPGLIMIFLCAMLTESSIDILLRFTRVSKSFTYSGVVSDAFGGPGRVLLHLCIIVNNTGMLIVYMIIIGTHILSSNFMFLYNKFNIPFF